MLVPVCTNIRKVKRNIYRRDFLRNVALTGASLALPSPAAFAFSASAGIQQVIGSRFSVTAAPNGLLTLTRRNSKVLFRGGTVKAFTSAGPVCLDQESFRHRISGSPFRDECGTGVQMRIQSADPKKGLQMETLIRLYDHTDLVVLETALTNNSEVDLGITGIEPLHVTGQGTVLLPGVSSCLTNGAMYYDAGRVHTFGDPYPDLFPYGETKGGKFSDPDQLCGDNTVTSWWNICFYSGTSAESLMAGYLENRNGLGRIRTCRTEPDAVMLEAESVFAPGTLLRPGQTIRSDRFALIIEDNAHKTLEAYASLVGRLNHARTGSVINGWCSWFYTYEHVTEEEVMRNAAFVARKLKSYGMEYIQVDGGYQRWHGEWEGNEKFPHGMAWLAEQIHGLGLKAGIWIAPFVVSEPSPLFREHPEWLLKNPDGSLKRIGPWPSEDTDWARNEQPRRYCLDVTHPWAAAWLESLADTLLNRWKYDMIKVDFVAWTVLSAYQFHDPSCTPAQAYRLAYEILRKGGGNDFHLLECGPGAISTGLIDSMRIELDQNYGYGSAAWKQYFLEPSSSGPAVAKRYYFHKKAWVNDADHLCINLLSERQAQAAATLIALSGGNTMSGDRLTELDSRRLDILQKALPSWGETARPADLFVKGGEMTLTLTVNKSFGRWTLVALFNPGTAGMLHSTLALRDLTGGEGPFLVYDFWQEKFLGIFSGTMDVSVEPESVTLLTIQQVTGLPQFLSTNRHIVQGALELEQFSWEPESGTLSGVSTGPVHSTHDVLVYLPEEVEFNQAHGGLFHDFDTCTVSRIAPQILKIGLHFEEAVQIRWKVRLAEL